MTDFIWSSSPVPGEFIYPHNDYFYAAKGEEKLRDRDRGPSALAFAEDGLIDWIWHCYYDKATGDVIIYREDDPTNTTTTIFNKADITYLSLTFDQNARQFIAYQIEPEGVTPVIWIYWYDPTIPGFTHTQLADGNTPFCRLDYKVSVPEVNNSIGVFYQRAGQIFHRFQSDRYATEELVLVADNADLLNTVSVGFTRHNRLQLLYEDTPNNAINPLYNAPQDYIIVYKDYIEAADPLPVDYYQGVADLYKVVTFKFDYPLTNTVTNSFSINSLYEPTDTYSVYISTRLGGTEGCQFATVTSGSFVDYSTCGLTSGQSYYIHIVSHQDTDGFRVTFS